MLKFLYAKRNIIGVLVGVILIIVGGTYFLKHLDDKRTLEEERNTLIDYEQWHLPEGAKARIGSGTIRAMQYSPDGNLLAVVSDIGVWIFNVQTAEPQHLLAAHTGMISSISFSADGRTLAVGTVNGGAQLWDTSTGKHQKTFTRQIYRFGVNNVAFMSDSHILAVVSSYYTLVDLWDIATGKRINTSLAASENDLDANVRYIPDMYMGVGGYINTFSSDGKTIASYSNNGTFRFWDIATRKEIRTLKVEPSWQRMSFSSDMRTLAIANHKEPIQLWDVDTKTQTKTIKRDDLFPSFLVFNPSGNLLASYDDGAIRIWDVNTGEQKKKFKGHKNAVSAVAFSPDNRTIASASLDNTLRFWDIDTGKVKKTITGFGGYFRDVSLSADGKTLMSMGVSNSNIHLWNPNTGQHEKSFIGHKDGYSNAVINRDGSKIASYTSFEKSIRLWDVSTEKLRKIKKYGKGVSGMAFSSDGQTLAWWGVAGNRKNYIRYYDVETGSTLKTLQPANQLQGIYWHPKYIYFDEKMLVGIRSLVQELFVWNLDTGDYNITDLGDTGISVARFSPDGSVLAIVFGRFGPQVKGIVLRDVETGDHIRTLTGYTGGVLRLIFSPDGRMIASGGSQEETMRLWDIETGSSEVLMDSSWSEGYQRYDTVVASKLAFSPDGQTLASGMKLGDIYLWETATGAKKKILRGHSLRISHLFFSADGQTLISASDDGTMLIWDLTRP